MVRSKYNYTIDYFIAGPEMEAHKRASATLKMFIHNEFQDVFFRNRLFLRHVLDKVEEGSKLYQAS